MSISAVDAAKDYLAPQVETDAIMGGVITPELTFRMINTLLYYSTVTHYRIFAQLAGSALKSKMVLTDPALDNYIFAVSALQGQAQYGELGMITMYSSMTPFKEVTELVSLVDFNDPSQVNAYSALIGFLKKLDRLHCLMSNISSENISIRVLDHVLPQNILSKLNADWKSIPVYAYFTPPTKTHVQLLSDGFADILKVAADDDGLAIILS